MRALVADPAATPALALADVPEPEPGPGELLLQMQAASVNRGEVRMAPLQPAGKVLGWDVAGTVLAAGEGVRGFDEGERVVALDERGGSFAERVVVPAAWAAPLPAGLDAERASTLPVAGLTALGTLRAAHAHAGDRLLVTGAAGGVGVLAVQLAVAEGITVTGQVRSQERAATVRRLGAEPLLHAGDGAEVDGEFDVVLDGIGGSMFAPLVRALAPHGRLVAFGNSAGADSTFGIRDLYTRGATVRGFFVFTSVPPDQAVQDLALLADQVASGRLEVLVQAAAPLTGALPLLRDLLARRVTGKVVLTGA
ncbi:MAG TPA: zinc-binding dehydrogenase [Actinomycetes bacterium]|nr:zinc-binding dehydrogenase [Actinomycetes bacterium]